ncbi:MAG: HlyD family efflux transporter periplasmic adaptor subunit [Planctomycetaceae bacterium]|nr:HlyD family efflux transporter periplasmic adaptor subunit [Planctomycetaceae bacterium]
MSIDQSVDAQLIEQTKQQIRSLVNEITQLSKSDIAPEEFHGEFLPRVISALAAVGGALWTLDDNGSLGLAYHVNMRESRLHEDEDANKRHSRLLYRILRSGEGNLVPAQTVSEGDDEAGNPTDFLLVFGVIKTELETIGVIEILQRSDTSLTTQKGYLRFLEQMTGLASDYYKNRQLRNFGDRQNLWAQLEEFTKTIHKSLHKAETAYTIANEGRRLIECDRVSVALRRGSKCRIEAVSGQDIVDKRSTVVKLLGRLATSVVRCNEPVWYSGDTSNLAPQVERAVEEYVDESHTKMVAVFPLVRQKLSDADQEYEDPDKRDKAEQPFGALIVEQIEDSRVPERTRKRIEIVADHACSAMGNAIDYNNIFLMPLWRLIGKSKILLTARMLPKTISVSVLVIALVVFLCVFPWEFNMQTPGSLKPSVEATVYAMIDGDIVDLPARHGLRVNGPVVDPVTKNLIAKPTLLARMKSTDLDMKRNSLMGERDKVAKELASLRDLLTGSASIAPQDRAKYASQVDICILQLQYFDQQLKFLDSQQQDLEVYAPISGEVMDWNLENKLLGRPVRRGEMLMEIADLSQPWELELLMPEKRIGHVLNYKQILDAKYQESLEVSFVLASAPSERHWGEVESIHERAEVRGQDGNTVMIKIRLKEPEKLSGEGLRPGVSVTAKIHCGKKPAGYVLFYQAIEYLQKTVLFWWF